MRTHLLHMLVVVPVLIGAAAAQQPAAFPETRRVDHVDIYHTTSVADPYRWLEQMESDEVASWVRGQNDLTERFLAGVSERAAIRERLTELWNVARYGVPVRRGGRLFYRYNDGLSEQDMVRMVEQDGVTEQVVLDANSFSPDGDASLAAWAPSHDGKRLAYAVSIAGSDWWEWRVRDVETGTDLEDRLTRARYVGASWSHDGEGFFYARVPEPERDEGAFTRIDYGLIRYHALGTAQRDDRLIHDTSDRPELYCQAHVDRTGRHVVIDEFDMRSNTNRILLLSVDDPEQEPRVLVSGGGWQYRYIGNQQDTFWFWTNHEAPNWRVVAVDRRNPRIMREAIAEADIPLSTVSRVGDQFIASYLRDASTEVKVLDDEGAEVRRVELPAIGTAWGFAGEGDSSETFFGFESFIMPARVYRYDAASGEQSVFRAPEIAFDPARFEVAREFVTSRDGTRVPLFLAHRKDLGKNGRNRAYLYGYGGFYTSQTPGFSKAMLAFMEKGGVYALASIRGGGEYGVKWHAGGWRENKQNCFDDFIAAAEWLIDSGHSSPERLAIGGKSNGGLLVGACLTQRPDLFGAAIPQVGLFDMLRFHEMTVGRSWIPEYGSPDDRSMFRHLRAYSPLHNVEDGVAYPPTMILTGDHDDRVAPCHSYKFAAALQAAQAGDAPILLRVESDTGHGAGTPTSKSIDEWTDILAFMMKVM